MKKIYLMFIVLLFASGVIVNAQNTQTMKHAYLNDRGQIEVEEYQSTGDFVSGNRDFSFIEGFPKSFYANQYFKNFRGAVLADVNEDGIDEIIVGIDQKVYAISGDGNLLWESEVLPGYINYPPSVADIDQDGDLEIAVHTNSVSIYNGSVVLLDHLGSTIPGWPVSFDDNSMSCSPAIADLDADGNLEIISLERKPIEGGIETVVHVLNSLGEPFTENWPLTLPGTPAVTPSVGDVDNDGSNDIVVAMSNSNLYVLNSDATVHENFPVSNPASSISYQSPALVDLNNDGFLEIVGAWHGDSPGYFVYDYTGNFYNANWPYSVSGWTYSSPTVVDSDGDGEFEIYYGMPTFSEGNTADVVYGFNPEGEMLENFPINKEGGLEGIITVADVDGNGIQDLVFTSNITDAEGFGFIHAYGVDGSGEVEGFPLRPKGFTFLNSAVLGDVNNDEMLDLTALSYTQFTGGNDSIFINTYNLGVEYVPEDILSNGYHGGNAHNGFISATEDSSGTGLTELNKSQKLNIHPNPSAGMLNIEIPAGFESAQLKIMDIQGRLVYERKLSSNFSLEAQFDVNQLNSGSYFIILENENDLRINQWIKE